MPDGGQNYVVITREEGNVFMRWRWSVMPSTKSPNSIGTYPQYDALKSGLRFSEAGAQRSGRRALHQAERDGLVKAGRNSYVLTNVDDDNLEREFERIQRELKRRKNI
jgi:hypothetical protein